MKKVLVLISIPVALLIVWYFTRDAEAALRGPHGGELKQSGEYWVEMKSTTAMINTWLLDQHKITLSNSELMCECVLVYPDSSRVKVGMEPNGVDGFAGEIVKDSYIGCMVVYKVRGQVITAEFERKRDANTIWDVTYKEQ